MIYFVNAKINIGLYITGRRSDGYHDLSTLFYPVGKHNGSAANPSPFCDIIELSDETLTAAADYTESGVNFIFRGNVIDSPPEYNLIVRGAREFIDSLREEERKCLTGLTLRMEKHIPDGAGMGGGSADAVVVLKALNNRVMEMGGRGKGDTELEKMALRLGADCPVFVRNCPAYAEGVGEKLYPIDDILKGKWLVVTKPDLKISTREAFKGIHPRRPERELRELITLPIEQWRGNITNDFEDSLFPKYPILQQYKDNLYEEGAIYASMTGSGAAFYGIFPDEHSAAIAYEKQPSFYKTLILL